MQATKLLLLFALLLLLSCTQQPAPTQVSGFQPENTPATSSEASGNTVESRMTVKNFAFEPTEIRVKQGDRVLIHVKSVEGHHGIAINDFGVSADLPEGEEKTLDFIANKKGTFGFYCNVPCGSGHRNMKGNLIVE